MVLMHRTTVFKQDVSVVFTQMANEVFKGLKGIIMIKMSTKRDPIKLICILFKRTAVSQQI